LQTVTFTHIHPETDTEYTVTAEISPVRFNDFFEGIHEPQIDVTITSVVNQSGGEVPIEHFDLFERQDMRDAAVDAKGRKEVIKERAAYLLDGTNVR
jgi:hypothetical protein